MNSHGIWLITDTNVPPNAAMLDYLMPDWVRIPYNWDRIEISPGNYDWTRYDRDFAILQARGITILPCVTDTPFPGIYSTDPDQNCGPLTLVGKVAFRDFLIAAMNRYGTNGTQAVQYWQILNEADYVPYPGYGGGCLGSDPIDYLPYLQAARAAQQQADPNAKIVFAALSAADCYDANQQPIVTPDWNCNFFPELLAAGTGQYFDVAAFNAYHFYRRGHERANFPGGLIPKVERWRNYMADARIGKSIIITEAGREYGVDPGSTELDQSVQLAKVVAYNMVWTAALATQRNRAPLLATIHFSIQNGDKDKHGWYGLFQTNGQPSLAAPVYAFMKTVLQGCTFLQDASEPTTTPDRTWLFDTLQQWRFRHPSPGIERRIYWMDSGRGDAVSTPATRQIQLDSSKVLGVTTSNGANVPIIDGVITVGDTPIVVTLSTGSQQSFVPGVEFTEGGTGGTPHSASAIADGGFRTMPIEEEATMQYLDFHGRVTEIPNDGVKQAQVFRATPKSGQVHAQLRRMRETRINNKPVVTDEHGIANRMLTIEIAHSNPAADQGERARDVPPNARGHRRAETFSLHEAEQGIVLGGGSKIINDPVDAFWVTGKYGDLEIVSDVLLTGLYSSDITAGGEWALVYIK